MGVYMPADFDKCVKSGGRVRTKDLDDGKYMHICYDKNGKSHAGEVKTKKKDNEAELNNMSSHKNDKIEAISNFNIDYITNINDVKIEAEKGMKKVVITGTLMNDKANGNNWKIKANEVPSVAASVKGRPVKIQHSESDWEIVGTNVSGVPMESMIGYVAEITDPSAIQKFETGTWNAQNMGISPRMNFKTIECSYCGEKVKMVMTPFGSMIDHPHKRGEDIKGKIVNYELCGASIMETSLTSNPAYRESGAGSIDGVTLYASLEKMFANVEKTDKLEVDIMAENDLELIIAQKNTEIDKLMAEKNELLAKIDGVEKLVAERDAKVRELETSFNATSERLNTFVKAERERILKEHIKDESLIAEIMSKNMLDEEFSAQIKLIEKIQGSTRVDVGGSVPTDAQTTKQEDMEALVAKELFGENFVAVLKK